MRVCASPQCPTLIEQGERYCPSCRPKRRAGYRSPESKQAQKALRSTRWRKFSERYRKANPWCAVCGGPAEVVDHLDGKGAAGPRGFDPSNVVSLCARDHNSKTALADGGFGRPRLEW